MYAKGELLPPKIKPALGVPCEAPPILSLPVLTLAPAAHEPPDIGCSVTLKALAVEL